MQIYRMFFGILCCRGATRYYPTDDDRLRTYFFDSFEEKRGEFQGVELREKVD